MKTIRETQFEEDNPFNARAMMENNWGQTFNERRTRRDRRRTWHESPLRWRGKCNRKEQYENEPADR